MKKFIIISSILFVTVGILLFIQPQHFEIEGVENGKVYAEDIDIKVNSGMISPAITLNDKVIDTEKTITKNGKYTLEAKSRFLWKETTKTLTFKRDDRPPSHPVLLEQPKKSYLKSASFQIKKAPRVTYEAKIDDTPYKWGEEITKEGKHTLSITALKENGLKSQNQYTFEIDNRTYTQAEVDDFVELYFQKTPEIWKYNTETDVFVHGNPSEEDYKKIKTVTEKLSELLPIQLNFKEKITGTDNSRIDVHFLPTSEFNQLGFDGDIVHEKGKIIGIARINYGFKNIGIKDSTVLIGTDTIRKERLATITHEMLHALGLQGHFEDDPTSILYPYANVNVQTSSEKDLKTLEILYRPDIQIGMDKEQVLRTLKERIE